MDEWEKFNETWLPEKEEFYSNLNMENITEADYMHVEIVCKGALKKKDFGEYHHSYYKNDTLLPTDFF